MKLCLGAQQADPSSPVFFFLALHLPLNRLVTYPISTMANDSVVRTNAINSEGLQGYLITSLNGGDTVTVFVKK